MIPTRLLIAVILVALIAGCSNTTRNRNVHYSGFLGDYSICRSAQHVRSRTAEPSGHGNFRFWIAQSSYTLLLTYTGH